nr:hypothetical protein [uncultured Kingella sp.]
MLHKAIFAALLACALCACQTPAPMVGNDADAHGCRASAGQTFSQLRQRCVRVFADADMRLPDPENATLAVYVLLSEDRQTAELFWAKLPQPILMEAAKGGYVSKDGKIRLTHHMDNQWLLRQSIR